MLQFPADMNLTERQKEILYFLDSHLSTKNYWPSIREIQDQFNFNSTNAVFGHLKALERKGALSRIPGQARTFQINLPSVGRSQPKPTQIEDIVEIDIELQGAIAAGFPDGIEPATEITRLKIDRNTADTLRNRRSFALRVRGESMINAGIFEGDIVVIESKQPRDGDIVAALIDGETTLKRFIQRESSTPFLKAENPSYPDLFPAAEMIIQGVAKAVVRNL
ncbi:MAG: repressor LexA [Opitutales bacterium]|nr:repressor LexA [Opitutales bacterium]